MSLPGSSNRYRLVEGLFQGAMDLPSDRRADFLARECDGDRILREEVEGLLRSHEVAGKFLDRPAQNQTSPADDASDPVRIGNYKVVRRLGRGGMGIVFEATQENPQRSVAVKAIRPGAFSADALHRFEFETSALARLQHPGIAQIYEVSTWDDGGGPRPFFAMELVDGVPLDAFIVEHKPAIKARLRLFIAICDAVQHAHQKGRHPP